MWRQLTNYPAHSHGIKLMRSFEPESWLKSAADRIPEEVIMSEKGYSAILAEIVNIMKPYLELEPEMVVEEFMFNVFKPHS